MLLYGIRDFYYTERLLLLQCIKHLIHISMWPDEKASNVRKNKILQYKSMQECYNLLSNQFFASEYSKLIR